MNIIFVMYHDFTSNSSIQAFGLANALCDEGLNCLVCVPDNKNTIVDIGTPKFEALTFQEARKSLPDRLTTTGPALIHAWTPREIVRKFTMELVKRYGFPYMVHMEDNEEHLLEQNWGGPIEQLRRLDPGALDAIVSSGLSHPIRYREFLTSSIGVTVLIEKLLEFKPEHVPGCVFWPGYDSSLFDNLEQDSGARQKLGLSAGDFVVVYPGNVHPANRQEVLSLYLAIGLLARRRVPAKLVRTGRDWVQLLDKNLEGLRDNCVELGYVSRRELGEAMSIADALVQPGCTNEFNDYRFPAKLPEFLALGKPVLLPRTNIGLHLGDGEQCVLLYRGHALEIANKLEELYHDPTKRFEIGRKGREFAERNLHWARSAGTVKRFYDDVLQNLGPAIVLPPSRELETLSSEFVNRDALEAAVDRYSGHKPDALGYATVRDYCDSMDHLEPLATRNRDMKDVQRPWIFKAILGSVRPGAKLLEIGAGEPFVADLLWRAGYDVTVVDPYDGSGNGPREFRRFVKLCPGLRFFRQNFAEDISGLEPGGFDVVYSISVLEHVKRDEIDGVLAGMRKYVRNGGYHIHAIDHVLKGQGDAYHAELLTAIAAEFGISLIDIQDLFGRLESDTETYFLSASAHNLWRGSTPYEEFPMRRCVSIHFCFPS